MGKTSNTDPCFKSCGPGAVLNEDGVCRCRPPYVGDGKGGCKLDGYIAGMNDYRYFEAIGLTGDM